MSLIAFLIFVAVLGLIVWVITTYIPMPAPFPAIIIVIAVIVILIMLLQVLGVSTGSLRIN